MADLEVPIALRRARRSNASVVKQEDATETVVPRTPRRPRRIVRFSEPGQACGLTPMIRRTSINAARQPRRASTPGPRPPRASSDDEQRYLLDSLHHTAQGRVERRIRRGNVRDMVNRLEQDKRLRAWTARSEIRQLQREIEARDREIYELQNATVVIDTERVWTLERQVDELKNELAKRPDCTTPGAGIANDWALAMDDDVFSNGGDAYDDDDEDNDEFGDVTMAHLLTSTPSRAARSSFPTPPATSPMTPWARGAPAASTPTPTTRTRTRMSPSWLDVGVQAHLADVEKNQMREELASYQLEVGKLTATLDTYKNLASRLREQLADVEGTMPDADTDRDTEPRLAAAATAPDVIQAKVAALLQNAADSNAAVAQLSASIARLGFPGADAGDMVAAMASGFRTARLELEYLTPGEVTLPLTSRAADVLDLVLARLRQLARRAVEDEASIDEYHEQELSLRKQLSARVGLADELRAQAAQMKETLDRTKTELDQTRTDLDVTRTDLDTTKTDLHQAKVSNERLRAAVDGYARDLSELEALVQRMEREQGEKLAEAEDQQARLRREISSTQDSSTRHVVRLNKRHGEALAQRDARMLELRAETDRAMRSAHDTMGLLRLDMAAARTERDQAVGALDAVRLELCRVLALSREVMGGSKEGKVSLGRADDDGMLDELASAAAAVVAARPSNTTTTTSKKLRRRHDSGLGLLEEDHVEMD